MSERLALIIGNSEYEDATLAQLKAPDTDVRALAQALRDPLIGGFDQVTELVNQPENIVSRTIGMFFAKRKSDDLLLLYFSGHGVLDSNGRLFLAVKDTQRDLLTATALPAAFITDEMDSCRSKRQVLILDCCHSAAFSRGAKGDSPAVTQATFEGAGYGKVVLTASSATQSAWDGDQVVRQSQLSLFTSYLIDGLTTGSADRDQDGKIALDEWYDYAYDRVITQTPDQTPQRWVYNQAGDLFIARNPNPAVLKSADLPAELNQAIENPIPDVRLGAVKVLAGLLEGSDPALARAAQAALNKLAGDDSQKVARAASELLDSHAPAVPVRRPEPLPVIEPEPPVISPDVKPGERDSEPKIDSGHGIPRKLPAWAWMSGAAGLLVIVFAGLFFSGAFDRRTSPTPSILTGLSDSTFTPEASQGVPVVDKNTPEPTSQELVATSISGILFPTATSKPVETLAPTATLSNLLGGGTGGIVYTSNRDGAKDIYLINFTGGVIKRLTKSPGDDGYPSFSPDGSRILFHSDRAGNFDIYTMNADGSGVSQLTNNTTADTFANWSPDGKKIVFQSKRDSNREIYTMSADGSLQIRTAVSPSDEERPHWSPDGKQIIFTSRRDGNKEIYTMNADGSDWQRLTNSPSSEDHPSWSPDGTRILFSSDTSGNWEVYTMNADGSDWVNLSNNPANDDLPRWSPDGKYVAFASDRNGNTDIFVVKADGSGLFWVTADPSDDTEPAWQP